jgi:hypothetical protein
MTKLYAQPYDISATGFYFDSAEEYEKRSNNNRNEYGQRVEEYEIQFIDGERIDAELANAFGLNQTNLGTFFAVVEDWEAHEKIRLIIANGECGCDFDPSVSDIHRLDIDVYEVDTLTGLAERFVDEGLFGDVPKAFENYIDYEAIARDLSVEYATTTIAGDHFAYRCG